MKKPQRQIAVDLGEKEAEGIYANLAIISHSPSEFIIDFARLLPGLPKAKVCARLIMTPQNAKACAPRAAAPSRWRIRGSRFRRPDPAQGDALLPSRDERGVPARP